MIITISSSTSRSISSTIIITVTITSTSISTTSISITTITVAVTISNTFAIIIKITTIPEERHLWSPRDNQSHGSRIIKYSYQIYRTLNPKP